MTYFNTNHLLGTDRINATAKTESQEARIYTYFKRNWSRHISPSQVQAELGMLSTPITSVRRAITNLTNDGKLEKTNQQVDGLYDKPEYCWRLAKRQTELF